jgi:hypothetical protein
VIEYLSLRNITGLSDSGFVDLTLYDFISSMVLTFRQVPKRQHHVYRHTGIDNILDDLRAPDLERRAIAKIVRDTGGLISSGTRAREGESRNDFLKDGYTHDSSLHCFLKPIAPSLLSA